MDHVPGQHRPLGLELREHRDSSVILFLLTLKLVSTTNASVDETTRVLLRLEGLLIRVVGSVIIGSFGVRVVLCEVFGVLDFSEVAKLTLLSTALLKMRYGSGIIVFW